MKLRNLKYALDQMSEAELDSPVLLFHPFYRRTFQILTMDKLDALVPERNKGDNAMALIASEDPA